MVCHPITSTGCENFTVISRSNKMPETTIWCDVSLGLGWGLGKSSAERWSCGSGGRSSGRRSRSGIDTDTQPCIGPDIRAPIASGFVPFFQLCQRYSSLRFFNNLSATFSCVDKVPLVTFGDNGEVSFSRGCGCGNSEWHSSCTRRSGGGRVWNDSSLQVALTTTNVINTILVNVL